MLDIDVIAKIPSADKDRLILQLETAAWELWYTASQMIRKYDLAAKIDEGDIRSIDMTLAAAKGVMEARRNVAPAEAIEDGKTRPPTLGEKMESDRCVRCGITAYDQDKAHKNTTIDGHYFCRECYAIETNLPIWDGSEMPDCHIGIGAFVIELDRNSLHIHTRTVYNKNIYVVVGISLDTNAKIIHKVFFPQAAWTMEEAEKHAKALGIRGIMRRKISHGGVQDVIGNTLEGEDVIQWTENLLEEE